MKSQIQRLASHRLCIIYALFLFSISLPAQTNCPGFAPPDEHLYMVPNSILQEYNMAANDILFIHNYGNSQLCYLPSTVGIPPEIMLQLHELDRPSTISYSNYYNKFTTPASLNPGALPNDYWLLALVGPADYQLIERIRTKGVQVLDSAYPYGILVHANGSNLNEAAAICTSEGFRLIRDIFALPAEARLDNLLLKIASGEIQDSKATNLIFSTTGQVVVNIVPFKDGNEANTLSSISAFAQVAPPELARGKQDAYLIDPVYIIQLLRQVPSIAYIEGIVAPEPSSNIAMTGDLLNIEPVWSNLHYDGSGVTILHNDQGAYLEHQDFYLNQNDPQCQGPWNSATAEQCSIIKAISATVYNNGNAHGTHTAGLLAGRGHNSFNGDVNNMCKCSPRPEENSVPNGSSYQSVPNPYCGNFHPANPTVSGAAPGARIIGNNSFAYDQPPNLYSDITWMMKWGSDYDNNNIVDAVISSNSWFSESIDKSGNDPSSYGNYEPQAIAVDNAVRDANGAMPGNQEMLIVFAAGNNDMQTDIADLNPWTLVECPGVAKNALTVGATENPRCGFARHYECDYYENDGQNLKCHKKIPRQPREDWVYERSGRGLSQGRVKPDLVATGADILSAQSPVDDEHWTFECLDCRGFCPEYCTSCQSTSCNYIPSGYSSIYNAALCKNRSNNNTCYHDATGMPENFIDFTKETWSGPIYQTISGTSQATPIAAGAAAVFYQFYKDLYGCYPSPAMAKAALINGAVDISNADHMYPYMGRANCIVLRNQDESGTLINNPPSDISAYYSDKFAQVTRACTDQGWGRLNLGHSIEGPKEIGGRIFFTDECSAPRTVITSGGEHHYKFTVTDSAVPLKVTLVWTDAPGSYLCGEGINPGCLKNNLDLTVTAPSTESKEYHGNQFKPVETDSPNYKNWSSPNPSAYDSVNNVENVVIKNPARGDWDIKIYAQNVQMNPLGLQGQDYSVVYSGAVTPYCVPPSNNHHGRPLTNPSSSDENAAADDGIEISWEPPEHWGDWDDASGRSYQVWRGTSSDTLMPIVIGLPPETTNYIDNLAPNNEMQYYKIACVNSCGFSASSDLFVGMDSTIGGPDNFGPITVTDQEPCVKHGVKITWDVSPNVEWNDSGATGRHYEIWRSGIIVATAPFGDSSYKDAGGAAGTTYLYQVKYINGNGAANITSPVYGTDPGDVGAPGVFNKIFPFDNDESVPLSPTLDWEDSANATSYDLYLSKSNPPALHTANINASLLDISGLEAGQTYFWYIKANNNDCGYRNSSTWKFTVKPDSCMQPNVLSQALEVQDDNYCALTGIKITYPWDALNEWEDGGLSRTSRQYKILRKEKYSESLATPLPVYETIASIPYKICLQQFAGCGSKTFIDYSAIPGKSYNYKMRYINSCGNSLDVELPVPPETVTDAKNIPPSPEILSQTGRNYNVCPSMTVPLITDSDGSNYHWYRDDVPVCGNSASCIADQSGLYTVEYSSMPGCSGISPSGYYVNIDDCPDIRYASNNLSPDEENGNGILESGEIWNLTVNVENIGPGLATNVQGNLSADGILVFNNPGKFGNISSIDSGTNTGSYTFRIMPDPAQWYSTHLCGDSVAFSLTEKSSEYGAYHFPPENGAFSVSVGIPGGSLTSNITQTGNPAISNNATSPYQIYFPNAFSIQPTVDTAQVMITLNSALTQPSAAAAHLKDCVQVDLLRNSTVIGTIKPTGAAPASDSIYDIKSLYNNFGPSMTGTSYGLQIIETAGCPTGTSPGPTVTPSGMSMSVVKTARCSVLHKIAAMPDQGTTAGATTVMLSGAPGSFIAGHQYQVSFDLDNAACLGSNSQGAVIQTIYTDTRHMEIRTKGVPEGTKKAGIIVKDLTTNTSLCQPNAFQFKTLAFASNHLSSDISILDTKDNRSFDADNSISLPDSSIPSVLYGMTLAKDKVEQVPGRRLLAADYGTGNLQIFDATNFREANTVTVKLQDERPENPYIGYGAVDVAVASHNFAYVAHMTAGLDPPLPWNQFNIPWNPRPGGVSIVDLNATPEQLINAPNDGSTSESPGAPPGIHRIEASSFYPYTISILNLERDVDTSNWTELDGWPGEYAFVSGVGPQPPSFQRILCSCRKISPPHQISICERDEVSLNSCCPIGTIHDYCRPIYRPRPMRIGIIDLNEYRLKQLPFSMENLELNPNYRKYIGGFDPGHDGFTLGTSDQGIDFYSSSDGTNATVYAVSPSEDVLYYFDFLSAVRNPSSITATALPMTCLNNQGETSQCYPTDVKVQTLSGAPYAYVTNTANDSISGFQITPSTTAGLPSEPAFSSTFMENACSAQPQQHYPVSIDMRLKATNEGMDTWAYCADYASTTVTAFNFSQNSCVSLPVGLSPFRVVVQPVPTAKQAFQTVKDDMIYASPVDFSQPSQQLPLISEWENVQHLQETNASPQAVLSHIDVFQKNMNKWISNSTLNTNLNNGIDLYRAVYLQRNSLPGNP